jgi:ArsR family transcriptional regulator
VYYRTASAGIGRELTQQLASLIPKEDPALLADQRRMTAVLADRVKSAIASQSLADGARQSGSSTLGDSAGGSLDRLHDVLVDELGGEPIGDLLDIGTGTGVILRALGANATRAVGVDISTEALRIARTKTHSVGLSHCLFRRGDMYGLPFNSATFDTVTMDRILAESEAPDSAIREAARTLRAGGRLCLVEDFNVLSKRVGNPLAVIREWLAAAQLQCQRINPIDTESGHLVIVVARATPQVQLAA